MHFLELLEQVSDRDTAVYYAKNCGSIPKKNYAASRTLIDGNYSFGWCGTVQGHKFWAEIHTKLGNHTQDEEVTYEPKVYKMYKTQNFIEEVSSNIRDYSVIIKDTSIEDRRKLHSLLHCLDEPVFKTTGLSTDRSVGFSHFRWDTYDGVWAMAHKVGDNKQAITIQDFIAKFSKPNTTAPEEDIKVGAQYTNTTGAVCTIFEVNAGSQFDNVIRYKITKTSGGVTNRNNIRKNWKLLVTPTICEVLEARFSKEVAIKFANNIIKKSPLYSFANNIIKKSLLYSKVLTEKKTPLTLYFGKVHQNGINFGEKFIRVYQLKMRCQCAWIHSKNTHLKMYNMR